MKYTSRSLRGMNHLGSGHVLMNKPATQPAGPTLTDCANPYDTQTRNTAHSPPTGNSRPLGKFFRGKATSGNVLGLVGC
ncbi:hypothetical protein SAM23877_5530 [Streptomyces ambofaciens ATCC 23877]|uniref:Uncharacterized protein n=1 Tax=Streptomyces ambofaciens (strain ATCC 23877 / 3486 / DSM 40053 / JCM 4204 / NBRC 12836 / NRRL B-2516) TaxID=278992 RepID=A0A0K2AZN7_STRA7|nr:hypothetical protein SAM23877_5530 [Streptomyces ambofaciens ATCC 23877]